MDPLNVSLSIVGFAAGVMLWSRIANTVFANDKTVAKTEGVKTPAPADTRPDRALLWWLLDAAGVWLLIFSSLCVHFALGGASDAGWAWLFGGMTSAPGIVFVNVALRKRKRGSWT